VLGLNVTVCALTVAILKKIATMPKNVNFFMLSGLRVKVLV
jgi:hypothetical protein